MKKIFLIIVLILIITGCVNNEIKKEGNNLSYFTKDTKVYDVIDNNSFKGFGNLIFPINRNIPSDMTLENVGDIYIWYHYIDSNKTVEIVNYMKEKVDNGNKIFYDIYSEEEKNKNPDLKNTGLFFFKGNPNEKFAILNSGGGFSYVGAMHDSFPHALELSKKGYNAFALIYRPNPQLAMQDLSRAIAFVFEHKEELQVDVKDYSVWGGSAGARMAAWLGNYGSSYFGEKEYPKPNVVIMQYTGFSEVTGNEPPTYNCVGTSDDIANYKTMRNRINRIKKNGTDAEIEIFEGLPHGFGLGTGTKAEGWINNAIKFWERNTK
ncbi:alpha/beta hydrolase [uncultured Parvimonas sp.]|uniref:alpha/beta hydrolase n=1 Tax=uncultured Parvimonas sp. TaxID=747372 RepID=UPI0028D384F9|nr:alpha/beta hydrolase [uncultured Parvimonas sp.]